MPHCAQLKTCVAPGCTPQQRTDWKSRRLATATQPCQHKLPSLGFIAPHGRSIACQCIASAPAAAALVISESDQRYYRSIGQLDAETIALLQAPLPTDFYQLLAVHWDADERRAGTADTLTAEHLKKAYRRLQKLAHPDIAGEAATDLAALLNLAYTTLSDPAAKAAYDAELRTYRRGMGTYDGRPVSMWAGSEYETRAIFVDETSCIGCTQCTAVASSTFFMEDEWGRARVHTQWGDPEEYVKEAVGACPVDCIHYVDRAQLPLLEYVMKGCHRENVALMGRRRSGNMGMAPAGQSPFFKAELFLRARQKAGIDQVVRRGARMQDDVLAAAISRAWLSLPDEVRRKGWPEWSAAAEAAIAAAQAEQ